MRLRLSALAEGDLQPTAGELCKVEGLSKAVMLRGEQASVSALQ